MSYQFPLCGSLLLTVSELCQESYMTPFQVFSPLFTATPLQQAALFFQWASFLVLTFS